MNHNDLVIEITAMVNKAEPPMTSDCCIYRVPYDIRRLNEDVFAPKVISIGPFHHGHHRLEHMERYKLLYLKKFSEREGITLDTLINFVEEIEPSVRRCYSEKIELSWEKLVKVILVDSCFLFELFWRTYYDEWLEDDAIHSQPWLTTVIRLDLLLLENQLPFFVLERLFNLAFASSTNRRLPSFLELTFDYFGYYNKMNLAPKDVSMISHFTDLIRAFHLQSMDRRPRRVNESVIHLQSAAELVDAGVKFRTSTNPCLLDLRFSGKFLEIPQFKVEDWTELLFRNLVALEQCHYPFDAYITDYVAILNFLIGTSKDVDVLVQNGVILNWLGDSNSVAELYNRLWKNVTHLNFNSQYFKLCSDLNAFYNDPWHKMKATLRRDYCNTPWQTAASIAGIVLLVLSFIQTVFSILQVELQNSSSSSS